MHETPASRPGARRRRWVVAAATAVSLLVPAVATTIDAAPAEAANCLRAPWMKQTQAPEKRAAALLAASSQHQKYRWLVEQPANNPTQTDFGGVLYPAQLDCTPQITYVDGPDGVRAGEGVTAYPAPIAIASSWNTALAQTKGAEMGAEAFDKGKNGVLGPGLASGRTPLAGRTPEYFGEDPVLTGLLTAATVTGLEEGNRKKPVISNLKHYLANEQELDRGSSSSNVDERTLKQIYDLPFEIALKRSAPESVMCSYNQINGAYACENPLLDSTLKGELGFDGFVMSDFGAVHSTAASLVNGLDQELNRPIWYTPEKLDAALAAGEITQEQIEAAATRVIAGYIRGGLFDTLLPATPAADVSTAQHKATARQLAEQGTVLLKNDGLLPLTTTAGTKIAVFGPTASTTPTDGVSASSVCSMSIRFGTGPLRNTLACEDIVSPEAAIRERAAKSGASVTFNPGTDPASVAADAAAADVAIVFGYQRMGEFNDIPDLRLQGGGDALIKQVSAVNDSTVVVLNTGSAVEMPWIDDVQGVFEAWYPGEQGGPALAGLLFGDVNPSGKLPMTFPKALADTPTSTPAQYPGVFADGSTTRPAGSQEIRQVDYSEGLQVGYRWYQAQGIDPLFPFGHGLSYTDFAYTDTKVTSNSTKGDKLVRIRVRVTNTGDRPGTEVAQAYVALPDPAGEPSKRLVAWQRVTLQPGQQKWVDMLLSASDLADMHLLQHWDEGSGAWVTSPGSYEVTVGSSVETAVTSSLTVR
ncbi:beta-glucosidase [Clavibacter michiganensis]|uniref:beta-glucosidase n=1 Tax=Clavibacter michiganensis TaxID=28447 RepID=UPI00195ECD46|nr:glycoside hydrolase family 3 C-terminal domain-containing protein [Clavibacter michiganensis]MBM7412402.1 beta-glucosidase [Clavibacter michiganensis]